MITLKEFMEVVDYRITEGSDYTWSCFGDDAQPYCLSAWNGDQDGWSFNITFDTGTQEVYLVESCDYRRGRAYRLINPDYKNAYFEYANQHNSKYRDIAWDGIDYTDLEEDDDWIQKALAIRNDEDYDTRVSVPLELPDDELFQLMKLAHEKDVTLNELVERILREEIDKRKNETC